MLSYYNSVFLSYSNTEAELLPGLPCYEYNISDAESEPPPLFPKAGRSFTIPTATTPITEAIHTMIPFKNLETHF